MDILTDKASTLAGCVHADDDNGGHKDPDDPDTIDGEDDDDDDS